MSATTVLTRNDFATDTHAAKYRSTLDGHSIATGRLIEILNEPANEQRLVDAELDGRPALSGVVRYVEGDDAIREILETGSDGHRFRQAVGVAVRLKMERLGWATTGTKGSVRGARHFKKAERYARRATDVATSADRMLAALEAVTRIGDEAERRETGNQLMVALAATRAREGRPF
ncbi:MAG: hypothetical protein M3501_03520 [Actinomycetota bacterium]|nr:hypothetical protein [Actinomycetota bacterium]MDQ3351018.1 hypothetical protein [Actinomycetota bacterium]